MTERMMIKAWRKSASGKAYTVLIGSTWVDKNGVTRLNFDALPIADERGQVSCFLEARREADGASPAKSPSSGIDDDIPF